MTTQARIGHQGKLLLGDTAGTVFTEVAGVESISPPNYSVDAVETSTMDDADFYRRFIPGMIDPGEVSISGKLIAANTTQFGANGALGLMTSRAVRKVRVDLPPTGATPHRYEFDAFFTSFEPGEAQQGEAIPFSATLKVTGPVVQTN